MFTTYAGYDGNDSTILTPGLIFNPMVADVTEHLRRSGYRTSSNKEIAFQFIDNGSQKCGDGTSLLDYWWALWVRCPRAAESPGIDEGWITKLFDADMTVFGRVFLRPYLM